MKAIAIFVIWASYAVFVYGVDKARGNCTSFKTVAWPSPNAGDISVACGAGSVNSSGAGTSANAASSSPSTPPKVITVPHAGDQLYTKPVGPGLNGT